MKSTSFSGAQSAADRRAEEAAKAKEKMEIKDIEHLMFSFRGIHRISNLVGLHALRKLQLDNNEITRIEGLAAIPTLEWLDLSFNKIEKIEGLDALVNLTDLILYSNQIKKVENLDSLQKLECLSVGKNQLTTYQEVGSLPWCGLSPVAGSPSLTLLLLGCGVCVCALFQLSYLRRFRRLRLLVVEGNPFCDDPDTHAFILAHLPKLRFLDYRLVVKANVEKAKDRFINLLLNLEEQDQAEKEERQRTKAVAKEEAEYEVRLCCGGRRLPESTSLPVG